MRPSFGTIFILLFILQACHKKREKEEKAAPFHLSPVLQKRLKLATATEENVQGQLHLNGKVSAFEDKMVKISPLVDGGLCHKRPNIGRYTE